MIAKAAELFVGEISRQAWQQAHAAGRRTLQQVDVSATVLTDERFDFLFDLLPSEDMLALRIAPAPSALGGAPAAAAGAAASGGSSSAAAAAASFAGHYAGVAQ